MSFETKWLKSPKKERNLEQLIGRNGTIRYHIEQTPFRGILETEYGNTFTYKVKGTRHRPGIKKWIRTLIQHLDPIINVDFAQVKSPEKAHLIFFSVKHVSAPWDKATTGENIWNPQAGPGNNGVAYILSKNSRSASDQMATITHELGHALGLNTLKTNQITQNFQQRQLQCHTILRYMKASTTKILRSMTSTQWLSSGERKTILKPK